MKSIKMLMMAAFTINMNNNIAHNVNATDEKEVKKENNCYNPNPVKDTIKTSINLQALASE
ncbi:MAG: hypothetical protein ABIQ02_11040 [Saprospiraceae bacterium]